MKFDFSALRHRIRSSGRSQKALAAETGISEWQFSRKLNGGSGFTQTEILRICNAVHIPLGEIGLYFFRSENNRGRCPTSASATPSDPLISSSPSDW